MAPFTIREARPDEAAAFARVHRASQVAAYRAFRPPWDRRIRSVEERRAQWRDLLEDPEYGRERFALALEDGEGRLAGIASGGVAREAVPGHPGELYRIYLLGDAVGRGWGGALFDEAARRIAAGGHRAFFLRTLAVNARARGFYEHRGGALLREEAIETDLGTLPLALYGWTLAAT